MNVLAYAIAWSFFSLTWLADSSPSEPHTQFSLKSSAFANGSSIPAQYSYSGYGCAGRNTSPALAWSGAPDATQSFALTVFDPDAHGGGFWHWVVFDIPSTVTELPGNAGAGSGSLMPQGAVQGRNDFQTVGYGGPCPPAGGGVHHYHFTLYALDEHLDGLSPLTAGPTLVTAMRGHVLGKAELVGTFQR
jgi:Raf kinase inhibitor-like YbhB/YbcL family protein